MLDRIEALEKKVLNQGGLLDTLERLMAREFLPRLDKVERASSVCSGGAPLFQAEIVVMRRGELSSLLAPRRWPVASWVPIQVAVNDGAYEVLFLRLDDLSERESSEVIAYLC